MNKIYLLLTICVFTFSCTIDKEPAEKAFVPDPTIISEYHRVNNSDEVISKYTFDFQGRISKFFKLSNDYSINFEYDTEGKISNVIKKDLNDGLIESFPVTYDSENRIASLGSTLFTFHDANDTTPQSTFTLGNYLTDSAEFSESIHTDEEGSNIIETERIKIRYYLDDFNRVIRYNPLEEVIITNTETSEELFYASWFKSFGNSISFDEYNNIRWICSSLDNVSGHDYLVNSIANPLYSSQTNIQEVLWAMRKNIPELDDIDFAVILSANGIYEYEPPSDPDSVRKHVYEYEYNILDLPTSSSYGYYLNELYSGFELQSEWPYAKYYYQGDAIPE